MPTYRDAAVVLRGHSFGEADRIVVMLTQDHGKVRAVAKGVRKTTSKFGSRLEPTSHVEVQLHKGRELDIVQQVALLDTRSATRAHLESLTDALAMCEAVDRVCHDREPVPAIYRALVGALRTLEQRRSELVLGAFLFRLLALDGVGPVIDECVACGADIRGTVGGFSVARGGAECGSCHRGVALEATTGELLQLILSGRIGEALAREAADPPATAAACRQVSTVARSAMEHHVERRLRAMSVFHRSNPTGH
jgi:DNA repair protein RecO (recombination protein O)